MSKPENNNQTWSTWEELLLACAVHRHGTDSWDSVAGEINKQNSSPRPLTGLDCRNKYNDLKRRFSPEGGETVSEISWWLEELRKLRVDELRREVERYDLSISSLQMKVKRLEDEREKSLKEEEAVKGTESSDLVKITETVNNSDVPVIEPNRKIEESTELKSNRNGTDETDDKPVKEDSGKGSCDSVREGNDSPELKGEEGEVKETSDVQSSASLPRKEEETLGHDQPDNEDQSLTVDKTRVESGPLIEFIEILRSHPIGSHFSRRLESQETPEYEKIIRQHIDIELIRTRVHEGYYQTSKTKFYRDLLLLINNAKVFYGERSPESNSAMQLNELIKKHMTTLKKSNQTSPPKEEPLVTPKEELTLLSLQTKVSVSVKACRKRSSLAVRASTEPLKKNTKLVPTSDENEKKQVSEPEEEDETSDKDEEPIVNKKISRGRTRNVKTSLDDEQKKSDQEKKGKSTNVGSKKQSAASFLKRMKGAETVLETVKDGSSNGKNGAKSKHEKVAGKRATSKKPTTPAKKNTGAASKREATEKEEGSSTRPKKRTRRL
ncbi:unnamed protein product [Eruca vesicaria subsp. sativa]|uniref:Bromo domain-containing protein n=1 Tax=Eruca vesicaria subsp. sativa TaxID=29727 RepID=A0ABC8KT33_ERUVS|nr:unnamed protein product [Eruca vesicaria subsp. sativa]